MAIAAIIGAGFGLLVRHQVLRASEMLPWGLVYGTFWWFLGPLTALPLLLGEPLAWDLATARAQFPSLLGHVVYGAVTGLAFVALCRRRAAAGGSRAGLGTHVEGALAGLGGAWMLSALLDAQGLLTSGAGADGRLYPVSWVETSVLGVLVGLGYAALHPRSRAPGGVAVVRGTAYGFCWWGLATLTLLPLLDGAGLAWSADDARTAFPALPGYLLFGAAVALAHQWLEALVRLLFSDDVRDEADEGAAAVGLRSAGRGVVAGLVGGLAFTVVMVRVGALSDVAGLMGSTSPVTGFAVHLGISFLLGVAYGVAFRRQSHDVGSAVGWGLAYGFFWWVLGPITLLPVLLGGTPQWSAAAASEAFPSLIGHLAYGAGLGVTFFRLEARYSPWWMTRTQAQAARVERRREQVLSSAPALWALVVLIAVTVPIVLGGPAPR